jgi:antimicrobial peptide system SdpB family protein
MLTGTWTALGRWARPRLVVIPWGSGIGLARTVLALGTLGTLLATSPDVLMSPLAGQAPPPVCLGMARVGLWCQLPGGGQAARLLSIAVLLVTASGWRPRLTAIPHWYVSWSLLANSTIQDGGDQITTVLTLLLIPVALTDPRRWHWQRTSEQGSDLSRIIARAALLLIQLQVAGLYFQASVAKLGVTEWADGTAMFYWFRNNGFGAPGWLRPLTDAVTGPAITLSLLTWSAIAIEFALAIALLLRPPARRLLLAAGLLFHDAIALTMGLVSFDLAMSGALLLYLLPPGHHVRPPEWARYLTSQIRLGLPATGRYQGFPRRVYPLPQFGLPHWVRYPALTFRAWSLSIRDDHTTLREAAAHPKPRPQGRRQKTEECCSSEGSL